MPAEFTTEPDLAVLLDMPLAQVEKLRREKGWPHLRFGRFVIRYTPEHIEQIKRLHLVAPDSTVRAQSGQTPLSAKRTA